ncbi:MAG: hypothetical protein Q8S13_07400 [Dehalococcoidia bacterium]|nr:hypothetical protein [Dehalococcoidia bacterium]
MNAALDILAADVAATTGGKYDWISVTRLLYAIAPMRYQEARRIASIAGKVILAAIEMPVHQGAFPAVAAAIHPALAIPLMAQKVDLTSMRVTACHLTWHAREVLNGKNADPYPHADDLRKWASRAFIEYTAEAETQLAARDRLAFWNTVGEALDEVLAGLQAAVGAVAKKAAETAAGAAWAAVKPFVPYVLGGAGVLLVGGLVWRRMTR